MAEALNAKRNYEEDDLQYFSSIDEATKSWMNSLHNIWSLWKKSAGVTQTLQEYFETAPNPYLSALRILVNSIDFFRVKSKTSLSYTIVEELTNWVTPLKDNYKDCLVMDLKIATFRLVSKQKNMQLFKMISETYEFCKDNLCFIPFMEEFIQEKKFKEAGQYIEILKLQSYFSDPEVLLLPLILQNKTIIAEDFLKGQPEIQRKFVSYLDNLLARDKPSEFILDKFIMENKIPDVQISVIQHKPISKLVARLVKMFDLPPEICPFLRKKRSEGALQFLIYKRYIDGSSSKESWREMAKEAVNGNNELQLELLRSLIRVNDLAEALYFAELYNTPREDWPWPLQDYADDNSNSPNNSVNDARLYDHRNTNDKKQFYSLNLPRHCIHMIDDTKSFEDFLDYGLKNISIVGIDSEWKPNFNSTKPELALIQIATNENVYILDITTLGNIVPHLWTELGMCLFKNKSILKLGFAIAYDINVIQESLPALSNIRVCDDEYLDLSHLWKRLQNEDNFVFPHKGNPNFTNETLSKLVEICLGKKLNKSDQFSNWEQRPLREEQIIYAALDAYCLIEVYNALATQCNRLGISFQDMCHHAKDSSHKQSTDAESIKPSKPRKKKGQSKNEYSGNQFHETNHQTQASYKPLQIQYKLSKNQQKYSLSNSGYKETKFSKSVSQPLEMVHRGSQNYQRDVETFKQVNQGLLQVAGESASSLRLTVQSSPGFVCCSMLGGLSLQLRKCGLDCLYFDRDRGVDHSLRAAIDGRRILLTRNAHFEQFKQHLPPRYCYKVKEYKPEDQLLEILRHFNIEVTQADIFSRCQTCNADEFVYVSKDAMNQLLQRFGTTFYSHPGPSVVSTNQWHTRSHYDGISTQNRLARHSWQLHYDTLDISNCTTKYNVKVQIDLVPTNVLQHVHEFYVCEGCGKVHWFSPHTIRILNWNVKNFLS